MTGCLGFDEGFSVFVGNRFWRMDMQQMMAAMALQGAKMKGSLIRDIRKGCFPIS